jgi:uncharacterized membrane protein
MTRMDATFVKNLLDAAFLLTMAAWTGGMMSAAFVVWPELFRSVEESAAWRLVLAGLPRYYAWCATCGALALPAFLGAPLSYPEYRHALVGVQAGLLLIGTLAMLYGANSLAPALSAAGAVGPEGHERFATLRRRNAVMNLVVMALLAAVLIAHAFRPPPRTQGIIELTPQERFERQLKALQHPPAT